MNAPLISSIRVEGLFGLYTYELPPNGSFQDAAILYGDNGVGKSTILRLAFHMLSAANNRGHRNALYEASFDSFEVRLASGICLTAKRTQDTPPWLELLVLDGDKPVAHWKYRPKRSSEDPYVFGEIFSKQFADPAEQPLSDTFGRLFGRGDKAKKDKMPTLQR